MPFFRLAGIVLLFVSASHLAGHFLLVPGFRLAGGLSGLPPENATEKQLIVLMNEYHKEIGGKQISMMDIQDGLSLCYALFFALSGGLALLIFRPIRRNHRLLTRISFLYAAALLAGMLISMIYFFWLPVVSFLFGSTLFLIAGIQFSRSRQF